VKKTRKVLAFEVIIIVFTLAITLSLVFLIPAPIIEHNHQLVGGQREILFFDLQSGQTVTGTFYFSGGNGRTGFTINGPNNAEVIGSFTSEHQGNFKFVANIEGQYRLYISNDDLSSHYVDYDYTISSPILGFDPIVLIGLVIAISIVLTLVNIYLNWYRTNGDKGNPPQPIK
jgi:hypothetical protein